MMLASVADPGKYYQDKNPQRITLDPGTTVHISVFSKNSTVIDNTNPYQFTTQSGVFPGQIISRIAPVSVVANLEIPNITIRNDNLAIVTSSAPLIPASILIPRGIYDPNTLSIALEALLNAELLSTGNPDRVTVAFSTVSALMTIKIVPSISTFIIDDNTSFIKNSTNMFQAPTNMTTPKNEHIFRGVTMIHSPHIHMLASRFTSTSYLKSEGANHIVFLSMPWGEPWIRFKQFGAAQAFTNIQYGLKRETIFDQVEIKLIDDYGVPLTQYCPALSSEFFAFVVSLTV